MIENIEELKQQYNTLLKDIDFDKLELGLQKPNIFEVLRISNSEIRHSNFLAWLLNPDGNHGLGDIFLKRFLRDIFIDEKVKGIDQIEIEDLDFSNIDVRREWRNIDLLILLGDIVICIENKVLSKEGGDQLSRYKSIIESEFPSHRQAFVFLTPYGEHSIAESDYYSFISYDSIIEILNRILEVHAESINSAVYNYIHDYVIILKRNLMSNDQMTELAKRIYYNHKDVLKFIFDNKPDIAEDFKKYFQKKVKDSNWILGSGNKGYIRFMTPNIKDLIPKYKFSNGWPDKEGFLFEIDYFWANKKKLIFKTVISPGNELYATELGQILTNIPGSSPPPGKKWFVHFSIKEAFNLETLHEKTDIEIMEAIDKIWPKIEEIVYKVEEAMVENKDNLIKAMQPNE